MKTKTTTENKTPETRQITNFGIMDGKGREIGARVTCYEWDAVAVTSDISQMDAYDLNMLRLIEPGHYFHATVQATRNGLIYGASQDGAVFSTIEERDAYIARRIESSRKAAVKKGGR